MSKTAPPPPTPSLGRIIQEIRKAMGGAGTVNATLPLAMVFTGFSAYTLYKSIYIVPGGHRAVKFNAVTGLHNTSYGEGANLAIPYVETPVLMDVRNRATEIVSSTGSRDLQSIDMAVRVLYKPNLDNLHNIYRELGVGYAEAVLPSLINEVVKAVLAQFNAGELLAKRPEVSHRIALMLQQRARQFHVDISDVSITQMTFGKEYTNAVEAKQIAQQMAERAKFTVEQALQEKKGAILLAEGEAQAAALIGEAMKDNPGFIELRRLEAQRVISKAVANGKGGFLLDSTTLGLSSPRITSDNTHGGVASAAPVAAAASHRSAGEHHIPTSTVVIGLASAASALIGGLIVASIAKK